jgi:hypothetical protein
MADAVIGCSSQQAAKIAKNRTQGAAKLFVWSEQPEDPGEF